MTCYDSSVLIGYLAGDEAAVEYIEGHADERAVAPPLVMFEVYQGEVFKSGPSDLDAVDEALEWIDVLETTPEHARSAAELQADLQERGAPLAPRDAVIAGTAAAIEEPLAVSDSDFRIDGLTELVRVDFVSP